MRGEGCGFARQVAAVGLAALQELLQVLLLLGAARDHEGARELVRARLG